MVMDPFGFLVLMLESCQVYKVAVSIHDNLKKNGKQ